MNIGAELLISITVNVVAIAYFAGVHSEAQKNLEKSVDVIQKNFEDKLEELKKNFQEKIEDLKSNFQDRFNKVEEKQDKHNNLVERMALVEASSKSAHKREDELSEKVTELEEKYYEHIAKGN